MKQSETDTIPASLIRQFIFCPRIPYFMEVLQFEPQKPLWVKQGETFHKKQTDLTKHRTLKRFGLEKAQKLFKVNLRSETAGIHGVADMLMLTDKNVYPVEFKLESGKPYRGNILQTMAYGVMASETFSKIFSDAFILYSQSGRVMVLKYDQRWKEDLEKTVFRLKEVLESPFMPDTPASAAQCGQCEYINFCNDRF